MKFQPRTRFEALAGGGFLVVCGEGAWRPLSPPEAPGTAWKHLEAPGSPPTCMDEAEQPVQTLIYTMAYSMYYVLFVGFAFWVHLIGICGGL